MGRHILRLGHSSERGRQILTARFLALIRHGVDKQRQMWLSQAYRSTCYNGSRNTRIMNHLGTSFQSLDRPLQFSFSDDYCPGSCCREEGNFERFVLRSRRTCGARPHLTTSGGAAGTAGFWTEIPSFVSPDMLLFSGMARRTRR